VAPQPVVFEWTRVSGADAYLLKVGTEPGRGNLVRSGKIHDTRYVVDELPGGRSLHARVSARRGSGWKHADLAFVASPLAAEWVHPRPGSADASLRLGIEWTPVPGAEEYTIGIGREPRRFDLVNVSVGKRTMWRASGVPVGRRLFGSIGTRIGGTWRYRDADFAFELGYQPAAPIHPAPNGTADGSRPFVWSAHPLASGYRLRIGSAEGRFDLYDSGPIGVPERFVAGLPPGRSLFATLTTLFADRAVDTRFAFRSGVGSPAERDAVRAALALTGAIRQMAGYDAAWPRTILDQAVRDAGAAGPGCSDYAVALVRSLKDQNNPLPARATHSCLLANSFDCHSLVELLLPSRGTWMILDPTFGIAVRRRSDGGWASASDLSKAARDGDWKAVSYVALANGSLALLRSYYIDYPLLFVSPLRSEHPTEGPGPSILRYYSEVPLPVREDHGSYAVRCPDGEPAHLLVDGRLVTFECSGRDRLSPVREASSVESPGGLPTRARLYRLRRFVF
jgi:hypothetical protein